MGALPRAAENNMTFRRTIIQRNYDSVLNPARPGQPATLIIRLKVALYPLDPSAVWIAGGAPPPPTHLADDRSPARHGSVLDYNKHPVKCRSWTIPEWNGFKIRFKRTVEEAWNNQMILLPTEKGGNLGVLSDDDFRQLVSNPRVQAHVKCALDIELLPIGVSGHALIEAVHLERPGSRFRNWMLRISDESVQFAMHPDNRWPSLTIGHTAAAHEAGHWLRQPHSQLFPHIDATYASHLPKAQRAEEQYGHTGGKRVALMGAGSLATDYEAGPWLTAIRDHTNLQFDWKMIHRLRFGAVIDQVSAHQQPLAGINARP